jgi:hypothetical protein
MANVCAVGKTMSDFEDEPAEEIITSGTGTTFMEDVILLTLGYLTELSEMAEYYEQRDQCVVPQRLWRTWVQEQEAEVLLLELEQEGRTQLLCIGGSTNESDSVVFLPKRCFLEFDVAAFVHVRIKKVMPPLATKLTLKPLDNELYHCDIVSAVSAHLSQWQVLTKWTTLTVPCEELGGYPVDIFVEDIEPAAIVMLRGEVPMELMAPVETVHEWKTPAAPTETDHVPVNPDTDFTAFQEPLEPEPQETQKKFQPFSGKGYRLGD